MRILLGCLLLFFCHFSHGQETHLIRVVGVFGDVKVDGVPATSGQLVTVASNELTIAKKSHAYVLTPKGYSRRLDAGKYKIKKIEGFIYRTKYNTRPSLTGAVMVTPQEFEFIGVPQPQASAMLGDSVYLRWRITKYYQTTLTPPFKFSVKNMFEESLYDTLLQEPQFVLSPRQVNTKNHNAVLLSVTSANHKQVQSMVKFVPADETQWIATDLSTISADPLHKRLLGLIVYEEASLKYDLVFNIYKNLGIDTSSLPSDIRNHFNLLKDKYEFR